MALSPCNQKKKLNVGEILIDCVQYAKQIICFQHQSIPVLQETGIDFLALIKLGLLSNVLYGFVDGTHGKLHGFIKPTEIALIPMTSSCNSYQ